MKKREDYRNDHNWYFLDPDNRKEDPNTPMFCARCKRRMVPANSGDTYIQIELHPVNPWFRIPHTGISHNTLSIGFIGKDCLDKVKQDWGVMVES